jgi:hypothetical protein
MTAATQSRTIVGPATPLDAALWALDEGLWPVCITPWNDRRSKSPGKAPIGKAWGVERPERAFLEATYRRHPQAGVGLKLGAEGRVVDLDIDDPDQAGPVLARLFPDGLPETARWENAAGRFHLLFRYDDRLANLGKSIIKGGEHYPGLEVRIGAPPGDARQLQSVIPPSLMTNGAARRWAHFGPILALPESVIRDLEAHAVTQPGPPSAKSPAAPPRVRDAGRRTTSSDGTTISHDDPLSRARKYLDGCPPAVSGNGGHTQTLKVATAIGPGFDLAPDVAFAMLRDHYNPRCDPPWTEAELRHKVEDAYRNETRRGFVLDTPLARANGRAHAGPDLGVRPGRDGQGGAPPNDGKGGKGPDGGARVITITTAEYDVIDQAVDALGDAPNVYKRGNMLMTIVRDDTPKGKIILRPPGSPRITPLPNPSLRELLTRCARWVKWKTKDGDEYTSASHPPDWAAPAVAARGSWPNVRLIEAVTETPVLRLDGTILDRPGYDERTGLLFEPNAPFPPIPASPKLVDARVAADVLMELVSDFPFDSEHHRAAWLAALLTPLARFAIAGPCPLFLIDANTPGTGKSKLIDVIAVVATGRPMPRTAYPDNDDEMRKRISSIALAGDRLMLLDNIATTFGGSSLDSALTAMTWRDRILGRSEMTAELPLFTVWYATGNNVSLRGDVLRRLVPCRLETREERPEERRVFTIKGDLLEYVRRERPGLVAAALTVLRAHAIAGSPDGGLNPLGSFEAWSRVVRSAVYWATGLDPCQTREELRATDPEVLARTALVEGWLDLPEGRTGMTAAEALKLVKEEPVRYQKVHDVFMEWSRNDELPSARSIGMKLKALKGRVINGKFFRSEEDRGTQVWRVEIVPKPE